jgi:hypothetical protein
MSSSLCVTPASEPGSRPFRDIVRDVLDTGSGPV